MVGITSPPLQRKQANSTPEAGSLAPETSLVESLVPTPQVLPTAVSPPSPPVKVVAGREGGELAELVAAGGLQPPPPPVDSLPQALAGATLPSPPDQSANAPHLPPALAALTRDQTVEPMKEVTPALSVQDEITLLNAGLEAWQKAKAPVSSKWLEIVRTAAGLVLPAVVDAGLTALAPEGAPLIAELTPAISENVEAAIDWATLGLGDDEQLFDSLGNPLPPALTLPALVDQVRAAIERPKPLRVSLPDEATPAQMAQHLNEERSRRVADLRAWLRDYDMKVNPASAEYLDYDIEELGPGDFISVHTPGSTSGSASSSYDALHDEALYPAAHKSPIIKKGRLPSATQKPGYRETSEGIWVKTGDHSLEATGITSKLLLEEDAATTGPADFIRLYGPTTSTRNDQFAYVAGQGIQMTARIGVSAPGGGLTPTHDVVGTVLPFHGAPLNAGDARHDLHLHTGPAQEISTFSDADINHWITGGVANEKAVSNAIAGELRMANRVALSALTTCAMRGYRVFDNYLLYGKLIYWALVHDEFTFAGQAPAVVDFVVGDPVPAAVNLDDANLDPTTLPGLITQNSMILVEGRDFSAGTPSDLQILHWITAPGCRINGTAAAGAVPAAASPHSCYLQWPAIPLAVLTHGAAPNWPAAALVSARALIDFALRLANTRQEWKSLERGIYLAFDLIGLHMIGHGAAQFTALRSDLSPVHPRVPGCADYNFMFRLTNLFPTERDPGARLEAQAFAGLTSSDRVRLITLYTAVKSSATTTLMYDLNMTCTDLAHWGDGGAVSNIFHAIMLGGLNTVSPANITGEPSMIGGPRKAFRLWLCCGVESDLLPQNTWGGPAGGQWGYANVYNHMLQTAAPRHHSPLLIHNWIKILPVEWGLVAPKPKVNIESDLIYSGLAANRGWYASKGASSYCAAIHGRTPFRAQIYGAQIPNVLTQSIRLAEGDIGVFSFQSAQWHALQTVEGTSAQWEAIADELAADHPYIPGIFSYEPCTFRSFDYATATVRAPCKRGANIAAQLFTYMNMRGEVLETVGVTINTPLSVGMPIDLFGQLNLDFGMLSAGGRSAPAEVASGASGSSAPVNPP